MFEENSYELILERMLSRIPDKFDKREGSIIYDAHSPTALELQFIYIELERIIKESFGDTASRDFLILRCKERGILPHEATKAVLRGSFTPSSVDVIGKRFNIGSVNYVVTKRIGSGEYQVECENYGIVGNQQLGTMIPIDYIEGLETAELKELLIPGEDEEDTENLRKRYFASFDEKAFGGNAQDYIQRTNAIAGVGSTKVTRVWNNDIRPADMIPSTAVKTWYDGIKYSLSGEPAAWLETIFNAAEQKKLTTGGTVLLTILNSDFDIASDTLVQKVQQEIDPDENSGEGVGLAPIGHIVKVQSAEGVKIEIRTDISFEGGSGWEILQSAINKAVSDYLLELRKNWANNSSLTIRISQIETRILAVNGILDIGNTTVNGKADNLTLNNYQVPIFGGVGR